MFLDWQWLSVTSDKIVSGTIEQFYYFLPYTVLIF